ncbi:MAG: amidohydrolase family protein [Gemmatimonadota bacterium]
MRVYRARWVLPIATPPIPDGAVAVDGEHIAFVGPSALAPEGTLVDLGDAMLLPGLVNTHTHLELTAMRGFLEELDFRPWIVRLTRARQAVLSHELLLASATAGIAEGLLAGVTTFADTCESGAALQAMTEMGVRGIMYLEVFGPDPAQCDASIAGLRSRLEALRRGASGRVRLGISPHAPYTVSDPLFAASARLAIDDGWSMAVHLAESEAEDRLVRDGRGVFAEALQARGISIAPRADSPVALLDRLGVLQARPLLIHCVRASTPDIRRIARYDCSIAHCPASNAKLGHGIAPLAEWLDAGIRVGLGTDSMASNNRMDILDEARVAVLMQRALSRRYDVLSSTRVLDLATRGGAAALGIEGEVGTLEAGKQADLAAFSLGSPRTTPAFAPEDTLVWSLAGRGAELVVVAGVERVRDGRLIHPPDASFAALDEARRALTRWHRAEEE